MDLSPATTLSQGLLSWGFIHARNIVIVSLPLPLLHGLCVVGFRRHGRTHSVWTFLPR
jgi:hypothetical protein